jgi:hypothetical protein
MKQKLMELKGEIDESTTVFVDFNTPCSEICRISTQKNCNIIKTSEKLYQ